ncbi:autophagy-related protein 5, partial [Nannochloropsis oceanica]
MESSSSSLGPSSPPPAPPPPDPSTIQSTLWSSAIPIELTMKESEVAGISTPLPFYALLPRLGYLPLAALDAIVLFGGIAAEAGPPSQKSVWFECCCSEEEEGGREGGEMRWMPLKWHLPGGVLYDLFKRGGGRGATGGGGGGGGGESDKSREGGQKLPWRIRVRFQHLPQDQVLDLPFPSSPSSSSYASSISLAVQQHFRGRLKQASHLQHGGSGPAMGLAKEDEVALWEAVASSDFSRYQGPVWKLIASRPQRLPLRLHIGRDPALLPSFPSSLPSSSPSSDRMTLGQAL